MTTALVALALAFVPQAPGPVQAPDFASAAAGAEAALAESLAALARLREEIAAEQLPLARRLNEREAELTRLRAEFQETARTLDGRTLDLGNLGRELQARREETSYLAGLFGEYVRNFEARLHVAELRRYEAPLAAAKLAAENSALAPGEVFGAEVELLAASLERLHDALGGTRFEGRAVDAAGRVHEGVFVRVGPVALFATPDGRTVGTIEQRLGSLEPSIVAFEDPELAQGAARFVATSGGRFPLDPTLGNAHKVAAVDETLLEHVRKGGPVMWPIFALAAAALIVALTKWVGLALVRRPARRELQALLAAVARGDREGARREAAALRGPAGAMLRAGVEHLDEPRELVEEVMYESVLTTRLSLQRWLPFVAITSSSAPLLGLLGTVTGIMNTFTLMTVFGTGDVKTLSSGISEALITTEYGLYVAIPSLLLYAFLSRKARGIVDHMETSAVAFLNQAARTESRASETNGASAAGSAGATRVHAPAPASEPRARVATVLAE
jgi:biopolymer transport protein ExbB